ncbi:MAG: hypothetical protein JNJ48_00810 [Phycisphaerae bacterium]|nr:hypothetical protein [Phycisphaerae bacterium]
MPTSQPGRTMTIGFFFLCLGVLAAGVLLMALAWRGRRINDHPTCAWCNFDLDGVLPAGVTCPECGAGLKRPKSVRNGARRKMPVLGLLAAILILMPAATLGLAFFAAVTGANLHKHLPVGVLLWQSRFADRPTGRAIADELHDRLTNKLLDKAQTAQVLAHVLDLQADSNRRWDDAWAELIDRVRLNGEFDEASERRYFRQAVAFSATTRASVRAGDPLPVRLTIAEPRLSPSDTLMLNVWLPKGSLGDKPVNREGRQGMLPLLRGVAPQNDLLGTLYLVAARPGSTFWGGDRELEVTLRCPSTVAPGRHTLALDVVWKAQQQNGPMDVMVGFRTPGPDDPKADRVRLEVPVEVLPPDRDSVVAIEPGPADMDALARMLQPQPAGLVLSEFPAGRDLPAGATPRRQLALTILVDDPPVGFAFDVYAAQGERQWRLGAISSSRLILPDDRTSSAGVYAWSGGASGNSKRRVMLGDVRGSAGDTFDLVFKPSAIAARRTLDLRAYSAREVVIRGVKALRRSGTTGLPDGDDVEPGEPEPTEPPAGVEP